MPPTPVGSSFPSNPIILYDGFCGLCNRFVQSVLKLDHDDRFRFAALQSPFAKTILMRHAADSDGVNTIFSVLDYGQPGEKLTARSDAAIAILAELGDFWRGLGVVLALLPKWLRDWSYGLVARNRFRIFGKYDQCLLPEERYRHKFLDM